MRRVRRSARPIGSRDRRLNRPRRNPYRATKALYPSPLHPVSIGFRSTKKILLGALDASHSLPKLLRVEA